MWKFWLFIVICRLIPYIAYKFSFTSIVFSKLKIEKKDNTIKAVHQIRQRALKKILENNEINTNSQRLNDSKINLFIFLIQKNTYFYNKISVGYQSPNVQAETI